MSQYTTDVKPTGSGITALRFDLIAGLTAAAVVLPKAMAYAPGAGLPVAVGLYTAFIPMVVDALLGSSRVLSVGSPPRVERDGVVCAARFVTRPERELHHDAGNPCRHTARADRAGRRSSTPGH